jgi:hypothetical protein
VVFPKGTKLYIFSILIVKQFLLKLFYFLLIFLILCLLLDILISSHLKKSNEYPGEFEVWNDIYNSTIEADLAIYGSSRAWVMFNSSILENELKKNVYNFGIDGHNFKLQYARHLEYLKHNPKPKNYYPFSRHR